MSNTKILRILIVEDLPERQEKLCKMYQKHAWITTDTALHAIKLLSVYDFDLILLDYNLANNTTGFEVAKFINTSRNANTKVVIHSMNPQGANEMQKFLIDAEVIPIAKLTKKEMYSKRLEEQLKKNKINWSYVFKGY